MAGSELVADGLTKPLQGQSFSKFVQRLGMTLDEERQVRRLQMTAEAARHDRWKSAVPLLAMLGYSLLKVNEVLGSLLVLLAGLVKLKWEGTRSNQERQESQEMTGVGGPQFKMAMKPHFKMGRMPQFKMAMKPHFKMARMPHFKMARMPHLKMARRPHLKMARRPHIKMATEPHIKMAKRPHIKMAEGPQHL